MKKVFILVFISFAALIGSACSETASQENEWKKNTISTTKLSREEKKILQLVGVDTGMSVFSFKADESVTHIQIWLEEYRNGERLETTQTGTFKISSEEGRMVVKKNKITDLISWEIGMQDDYESDTMSFKSPFDEKRKRLQPLCFQRSYRLTTKKQ